MSQVPSNLPVEDLAGGRVLVFADMAQWERDKEKIAEDMAALASGLQEKLDAATDRFEERFGSVLDRLQQKFDALKVPDGSPHGDHEEQPGADHPLREMPEEDRGDHAGDATTGQPAAVRLDDASMTAIRDLQASMDSLAAVMAQR